MVAHERTQLHQTVISSTVPLIGSSTHDASVELKGHFPMELTDFTVGDRIRIHPASDWFMRGVVFATVTVVGRKALTVKADRMILTFKLHPRNVLEITHRAHWAIT